MAYRILSISQEFRDKFTERENLEGPFFYDCNRVLYYSVKDGKYWNPLTDMFLTYDEYNQFINT